MRKQLNYIRVFVMLIATLFAIECKGSDVKRGLTELPNKPAIPTLSLPDPLGNVINIAEITSSVIVINFWATWCSSCVREMKTMHQTALALEKHDVSVVAINLSESIQTIRNFFRDYKPHYLVLSDQQSRSAKQWQIQGLPTTYVIGPDRKIHYGVIGLLDWESEDVLNQIIKLSKQSQNNTKQYKGKLLQVNSSEAQREAM